MNLEKRRYKDKVLKELPQEETTESLPWAESFEKFLRSTREKETVTQPRKKKISVTPGRSLSQDDFMDTLRDLGKATATTGKVQKNTAKKLKLAEEKNKQKNMEKPVVEVSDESDFSDHPVGAVAKRKNQKQNIRNKKTTKGNVKKQSKTTKRYDEESDNDRDLIDDDLFSLHDSDTSVGPEDFSDLNDNKPEDLDDIDEKKVGAIKNDNQTEKESCGSFQRDEYVQVQFIYDAGKKSEIEKLFVGKVLDKTDRKDLEESKFKISYMREYKGSSTIFVFPVVFDIEEDVTHDRIKKRLKVISEFRGRVTFEKQYTSPVFLYDL